MLNMYNICFYFSCSLTIGPFFTLFFAFQILYDFKVHYEQINTDALKTFWRINERKMPEFMNIVYDISVLNYPEEVKSFMILTSKIQQNLNLQKFVMTVKSLVTPVEVRLSPLQ